MIVDTAGRLHTQANLMEELAKVRRVIAGRLDGAPHETLLVVDATTGQNGLQQARLFAEAAGVTGVALTKLDGTAKGGIALAIAYELGLPVKLIGVGEGARRPPPVRRAGLRACAPDDRRLSLPRCAPRVSRGEPAWDAEPPRYPSADMFDPLSDRLQGALAGVRSRGRLDEETVSEGDARDPPRAARGRRQLRGREAVRRAASASARSARRS